jgi:hypothetical protein
MNKKDKKIIKELTKNARKRNKEWVKSLKIMTDEEVNDPNFKWPSIIEIVVDSQFTKDQLLIASKYIHDLTEINCDFHMVNVLAHLYTRPELITIEEE